MIRNHHTWEPTFRALSNVLDRANNKVVFPDLIILVVAAAADVSSLARE